MKVLIVHTDIDSGGDCFEIARIVDSNDPTLTYEINEVITQNHCPWECEDKEYELFRNALDSLPIPTFPAHIDKLIVDATHSY